MLRSDLAVALAEFAAARSYYIDCSRLFRVEMSAYELANLDCSHRH